MKVSIVYDAFGEIISVSRPSANAKVIVLWREWPDPCSRPMLMTASLKACSVDIGWIPPVLHWSKVCTAGPPVTRSLTD